jgi:glucose-1-phosphate cytidylyltransferase
MKAVILAGGFGTRLAEESTVKPKPMVEIGGKPILWHIMKIYSAHGINDFIICCGYKGSMIKEYFANYFLYTSDVTFDIENNRAEFHTPKAEPWRVTLIDTGENTMTGGRLKRVKDYIGSQTFCLTYGDALSNIDISKLIDFHEEQDTLATVTAVQPPGRFGTFRLSKWESKVSGFKEKRPGDGAWINGGYFVLESGIFDYISDDASVWEREPLENLSKNGLLSAFRHHGFWHPMDTLHDKNTLERLWESGNPPWKVW